MVTIAISLLVRELVRRGHQQLHTDTPTGHRAARALYERLGGNHRALEWLAHLLTQREHGVGEDLLQALASQKVPPRTPREAEAVVLEGMRQNLLLGELLEALGAGERRLLERAVGYRVAVTEDGLVAIDERPELNQEHRERLP